MILSRHEYRMWVRLREPRFYPRSSPAWTHEPPKHPGQWFVKVRPIRVSRSSYSKTDYWAWCNKNLQGRLLCYWSDTENQEEWWGFTNKDDIAIWLLKWNG